MRRKKTAREKLHQILRDFVVDLMDAETWKLREGQYRAFLAYDRAINRARLAVRRRK